MAPTRPTQQTDPRRNRLLAALPEDDYEEVLPALEPVALEPGTALYESGDAQPYLYFPVSGMVSLLYLLEDGGSTELAVTGREGVVGVSLFMGGDTTPSRAVVQIRGHAWRMPLVIKPTTRPAPLQLRGAGLVTLDRVDGCAISIGSSRSLWRASGHVPVFPSASGLARGDPRKSPQVTRQPVIHPSRRHPPVSVRPVLSRER